MRAEELQRRLEVLGLNAETVTKDYREEYEREGGLFDELRIATDEGVLVVRGWGTDGDFGLDVTLEPNTGTRSD